MSAFYRALRKEKSPTLAERRASWKKQRSTLAERRAFWKKTPALSERCHEAIWAVKRRHSAFWEWVGTHRLLCFVAVVLLLLLSPELGIENETAYGLMTLMFTYPLFLLAICLGEGVFEELPVAEAVWRLLVFIGYLWFVVRFTKGCLTYV